MSPRPCAKTACSPASPHIGFDHFVVVRGFKRDFVYVNDPAGGERKMSLEDFAIERLKGAKAAFIFVAITSAITALLGLVSPVMSQVFLDRLLTGTNATWTVPFLALLGAFFFVQVILSALNAVYLMRIEGKIAASSSAAFLWKVLHLPMEFFSQRLVSDIAQRMGTNAQIAQSCLTDSRPCLSRPSCWWSISSSC